MRPMLLTAAAAATLLLSGPFARDGEAAMLAAAPVFANHGGSLVRPVVNVCGSNGCVRVQTQRIRHQKKPSGLVGKRI